MKKIIQTILLFFVQVLIIFGQNHDLLYPISSHTQSLEYSNSAILCDDDIAKLLSGDITKSAYKFEEFITTEAGYKAWEAFREADDWARLNTDILNLIKGESDLIKRKLGDFYKTTMKNQTPSGFNGGEKVYGGVWFNKFGFPDFEKLNQTIGRKYYFAGAKGNYTTDFSEARDWLRKQIGIEAIDDYNGTGSPLNVKISGVWKKITWHHHEDGNHLVPVFTEFHTGLSHVGGVKTLELGINNFFKLNN